MSEWQLFLIIDFFWLTRNHFEIPPVAIFLPCVILIYTDMFEYLNDNDKKIYSLIRNRIVHGLETPTLREINELAGWSSPRSAVLALERLEKAGMIRRMPQNKIRLTSTSIDQNTSVSTIDIPLVGRIAAGEPILAEENVEAMIRVSTALARPGHKHFLLRVVGDSMNAVVLNGINIEDGCIVLVRQQPSADDGDKVVALLNDKATIKIFEKKNGIVLLKPKSTNPKHKPIVLSENCIIQGVVVAVLPKDLY